MDLFADNILDHYRDPRHKESIAEANASHSEANHSCGDIVEVELKITENTITDIGWQGTGCAISQAGMSMLAEEIVGMNTDDVLHFSKNDIYEMFGVPIGPRRFKCALISLHTIKNAIRKYNNLEPQGWLDTVEIDQ